MTVGQILDSCDPQPPVGTVVKDSAGGWLWANDGSPVCPWVTGLPGGDPESWTKVAGNYGPVTVVKWGSGPVNV